jgi:Fur family ferric uptake transcriptional regulator
MHLVCRDCGTVIEADVSVASALTDRLKVAYGFETDMKHFAIFGRCADCSAKAKDSTTEP